jgi:preprotein translocase subunit Sec63
MYEALKYNDSAFLYVLFTFQAIVVIAMVPFLLRDARDPDKRQHRKFNLLIRALIVGFFCKWMWDTYEIVQTQISEGDMTTFDPYKLLHLDNDHSFGTEQIRQAYHRLAKKYHPDKVDFSKVPEEKARRRYQNLVKAYKTLTVKESFDNWIKFGDPDGSRTLKALEIALPAFLASPEMRPTLYLTLFLMIVGSILGIYVW